MTQLTTQQDNFSTLSTLLLGDGMQKQLRLACTKSVTPERLARIALTELRRTPKLLECSQASILGALMQCAQLGLEPGPMGLAYIIPYGKEAQFQVGYKGILNLVWRSGEISSVQSEVVYEGDHFEYANGIPPLLRHVPAENRDSAAKPTHAYCCIGTKSGGWIFRVMTFDEIESHRKQYSQAGGKSPWVTAWNEQACKTVIKRTAKRAPVSAEAQTAIALDDMSEIGIAQNLGAAVEIEKVEQAEGEMSDAEKADIEAQEKADAK